MGTGYVWYSIPILTSDACNILISLCFRMGRLDSLTIAASDPSVGSRWDDWSEERERKSADRSEAWLTALGYPTGTYSWGTVWADYDPKSGSGSAGIRYNSEKSCG
jgi:hypothetical protein